MAEALVQSYLALDDPEQRRLALQKLVDRIPFCEVQAVCSYVHNRNDILPRLPAELILHIFSYLDIRDAWRLQLVNRAWRRTLSSDEFLKFTLARWDTHDPADNARSLQSRRTDSIADKIHHMQAITNGAPYSTTTYPDCGAGFDDRSIKNLWRLFDFKRDKVAYVVQRSKDNDHIAVRDLSSGAVSKLTGEARERIIRVALTTDFLAFITSDAWLYVTELSGHPILRPARKVRLPSILALTMAGHGRTFVIALGGALVMSVLVFDLDTNQLRSYPVELIEPEESENRRARSTRSSLLIDDTGGTIHIFNVIYDSGRNSLKNIRLSFEGRILGSTEWVIDKDNGSHDSWRALRPQPTGYADEYRITIAHCFPDSMFNPKDWFVVYYNAKTGSFIATPERDSQDMVSWRTWENEEDANRRRFCPLVYWKGLTTLPTIGRQSLASSSYVPVVMMNDTFLVTLEVAENDRTQSFVNVYCFDRKVGMHGERISHV